MPRLVCLANSIRHGGRCVAGIDLDSKEWVRPVPPSGDAIPGSECFIDSHWLTPLSLFEVDVARPSEVPRYQRENWLLQSWRWVGGELAREDLLAYCDETAPILHSGNDRVCPECLENLPPEKWTSLQLVRPRKLHFVRDHWKQQQWRAKFQDRAGNHYSLKITDDDIVRRLQAGQRVSDQSILTVSLTKPYARKECPSPPQCYKIVAAVIEF